jgi:glycine/D-amino acid oxidase-like deaminating enzyme
MVDSEIADVICIGAGSAGLAAAIAAADAGLSVFVADGRRRTLQTAGTDADSWATVIQRHWGAEEFDGPTTAYLHQLTHDLGSPRRSHVQGHLPIGCVESFDEPVFDRRGAVPPFHGHQNAHWARDCLTSPYALIFSRVSPLEMSEVRMQDGSTIRAGEVAAIPSTRRSGMTLRQWLRDMAKERGVRIHATGTIQRLLFSNGQPVGAEFETADGIRQIRASRGVLMGTSSSTADDLLAMNPASVLRNGRLSLVSRNASRFARLELLTEASMELCAPQGRLA